MGVTENVYCDPETAVNAEMVPFVAVISDCVTPVTDEPKFSVTGIGVVFVGLVTVVESVAVGPVVLIIVTPMNTVARWTIRRGCSSACS